MGTASYIALAERIAASGLLPRGGFHPGPEDGVPGLPDGRAVRTLVLIGNAGPGMWREFAPFLARHPGLRNPLNTWVMQTVGAIAVAFEAAAVYTHEGPPFYPFLRWAQRAEPVAPSPIGLLIHPVYGLWHAYRAALLFADEFALPSLAPAPSPCERCTARPCLGAGLADPRQRNGFDAARRACPVGSDFLYEPAQSAFHQAAFLSRQS